MKRGAKFATAEAKWDKESEGYKAPEIFPEDIPEPVYGRIQAAAVEAAKALRVLDYGRVDMRLRRGKRAGGAARAEADAHGWEFFIIEVNPNPYLEQRAEVAMAVRKHGLSYPDLIEEILELALRRRR